MKLCHTREELARLPQGPKLVLATLPSLQAGMARDLFMEWAPHPKNLILFTQQAEVLLHPTMHTSFPCRSLACLLHRHSHGVKPDQVGQAAGTVFSVSCWLCAPWQVLT